MSRRWAVRLDKNEMESVRKLRLAEGAEVCEREEDIWVRGTQLSESLAQLLRRHPHARRHWILADNQLISPDKLVPSGYLPEGPWTPLREWLTVCLPDTVFAAKPRTGIPLRLVRSEAAREPNLLLTSIRPWAEYGIVAPQVRLDRWFFATDAEGRVVVRGFPMPPLPGARFYEEQGVAVPAGWTWSPAVEVEILQEMLGLADQDLALLFVDNHFEIIWGEQFVKATRSAVRMTAGALPHG